MSTFDNSFLLFRNDDDNEDINNESFISTKKSFFNPVGFENKINDNNCFVSVVFHALFHFTKLKDNLINIQLTKSTPNLIVELISLLNAYQKINKEKEKGENNSSKLILNPTAFREVLATKKSEFQKNEQGDPIELLNYLFICLHNFMSSTNPNKLANSLLNQKCTSNNCLVHELFYIDISEISYCKNCKNKKELKYDSNYFTQLLNVDSILYNVKDVKKFDDIKGKIFSYSKIFGTQSSKCDKCKKENIENKFVCNSIGKYFIVNLGFDGTISKKEDLCKIYAMIGREFYIKDLYEYKNDLKLYFFGMFLYWGSHYVCLFFSPNMQKFIMYDDTSIKHYSTWKELIENLITNKYQPVALIYGEYEENKLKKLSPFNIDENFYNDILKKSIETDKNLTLLAAGRQKIKENEWLCEFCGNINDMNNENCLSCNKINENIALFIQMKYIELSNKNPQNLSKEDKDFLQIVNDKKNALNNIEKWICSYCGCNTNLITYKKCSICGSVKSIPKINNNDIHEKDNKDNKNNQKINQKENMEEIKGIKINNNEQNNLKNNEIVNNKNINKHINIKLNNKDNNISIDNNINSHKIKIQSITNKKNEENVIKDDIKKNEENEIKDNIKKNEENEIKSEFKKNEEKKINNDKKNEDHKMKDDIKKNKESKIKNDIKKKEENEINSEFKKKEENKIKEDKKNEESKIKNDIKKKEENEINNEFKKNEEKKIDNDKKNEDNKIKNDIKKNEESKINNEFKKNEEKKIDNDKKNEDNKIKNDIKKNEESKINNELKKNEKNEDNNKNKEKSNNNIKIQRPNDKNKENENKPPIPPIDNGKKKSSNEKLTIKDDEKEKKKNNKINIKNNNKDSRRNSNNPINFNNLQINNKNVEINSQNEQNKNNIWLCLWCGEINKNINDKYCTNCKKEKDKKTIKVICFICKQEKLNGYKCKSCNIQVKYDCPKCKKPLPIRIQKCVYCEKNIK